MVAVRDIFWGSFFVFATFSTEVLAFSDGIVYNAKKNETTEKGGRRRVFSLCKG